MNFARAVKGTLTRSRALQHVNSQSELELGRQLTKDEEAMLYKRLSPNTVMDRIDKVCLAVYSFSSSSILYNLVWIWVP